LIYYAVALRPAALGLGHIYQTNPSCHVITITYTLAVFDPPTHWDIKA